MGIRGPKTEKPKLSILSPVKKMRPNPPQGMTPNARTVWKRICKAYPVDHFKPQHYDQLRAYCEASSLHKKAVKGLMESDALVKQPNGVIKENPYIGIMDKMAGRMQGLAVKLGITKNATIATRGEAGESTKPKSKRAGLIFNG